MSAGSRTARISIATTDTLVVVFCALEVRDSEGELGGVGSDAIATDAGVIKGCLRCHCQLCKLKDTKEHSRDHSCSPPARRLH